MRVSIKEGDGSVCTIDPLWPVRRLTICFVFSHIINITIIITVSIIINQPWVLLYIAFLPPDSSSSRASWSTSALLPVQGCSWFVSQDPLQPILYLIAYIHLLSSKLTSNPLLKVILQMLNLTRENIFLGNYKTRLIFIRSDISRTCRLNHV